jgi:hypothetical protein
MTSKKSYLLAGAVALGVTAWMLSDNIVGSTPAPEVEVTKDAADAPKLPAAPKFIVSAVRVKNQPIIQVIRANGFRYASRTNTRRPGQS